MGNQTVRDALNPSWNLDDTVKVAPRSVESNDDEVDEENDQGTVRIRGDSKVATPVPPQSPPTPSPPPPPEVTPPTPELSSLSIESNYRNSRLYSTIGNIVLDLKQRKQYENAHNVLDTFRQSLLRLEETR